MLTLMNYTPEHITGLMDRLRPLATTTAVVAEAVMVLESILDPNLNPNLSIDLTNNTVTRFGKTVKLTPTQAVILWRLHQTPDDIVTLPELHAAVYGKGRQRSNNVVRVILNDMVKRVTSLRISARNYHGKGYKIDLLGLPRR